MRVLRQYGPLTTFSHRDSTSRGKEDDDLSEWKKYFDKSKQHSEKLMQNQPDIVTRLNAKTRLEKEKEIQRKEKETANHGEWHYNGEMDEYEWTGENEPEYYQEPLINEELTDAEKLISKEAEERWMNAAIEERKQQRREKRQQKDKERRRPWKNQSILCQPEKCANMRKYERGSSRKDKKLWPSVISLRIFWNQRKKWVSMEMNNCLIKV